MGYVKCKSFRMMKECIKTTKNGWEMAQKPGVYALPAESQVRSLASYDLLSITGSHTHALLGIP